MGRVWMLERVLVCVVLTYMLPIGLQGSPYELNTQSPESIKDVAKQMAEDLVSFYIGNQPGQTPGVLPEPYYWWEGGAFMGSLIDYWYYTKDDSYNDIAIQGLLFQVGPYNDYMPPNQSLTEGNDDQGFWGMAVISAAEYKFDNPPDDQPQWLALAQAVFNTQAARWDTGYCNGGLRWQIFTWNNGYNYKNSISQACFFNLAARLALYTGNSTYADWAVKTWDWMVDIKFLDPTYRIKDGAHVDDNCTTLIPYEFSYNTGAFLLGSAAMYAFSDKRNDASSRALWRERVDGLLNATEAVFFYADEGASEDDKVMIEIACEPVNLCNVDQQSFKAYLSRWMAATTKWAPWTFDRIKPLLVSSAAAAARQCTGGDNGRMCGLKWANNSGVWDGTTGVGQQMAAMEVVLGSMVQQAEDPVTNSTGGTSKGDPAAGGQDVGRKGDGGGGGKSGSVVNHLGPVTGADRAGAAICTVLLLAGFGVTLIFMLADERKSTQENWRSLRDSVASGGGGGEVAVPGAVPGDNTMNEGAAVVPGRGETTAVGATGDTPALLRSAVIFDAADGAASGSNMRKRGDAVRLNTIRDDTKENQASSSHTAAVMTPKPAVMRPAAEDDGSVRRAWSTAGNGGDYLVTPASSAETGRRKPSLLKKQRREP